MTTPRSLAAATAALLAVACGGGAKAPATNTGTTGVAGIALPSEVSALPAKAAAGMVGRMAPLAPALALVAPPAGSDYDLAQPRKWVNERSLDQFSVLNTIFGAMDQTHYADPANVGAGAYGATVSWTEDNGKQIVLWTTESTVVKEGGADVNVVHVWMNMVMGDGQLHVIQAAIKIYEAPARNADGSYASYGVWKLEAWTGTMSPLGWYFVAAADHGAAGESVVAVHQLENGSETAGVLHKSAASGYGKVLFPDWNQCNSPGCTPPEATVAYAYDASTVTIQVDGGAPVVKDRASPVDLVNRYKLFDAVTGDDVARHHTFGFPFRIASGPASGQWGNYGAWQGRHQVWGNGQQLAEGTQVVRADVPPAGAPGYTVSKPFAGVLVRRTLVAATLDDVKDSVLGTWTSRQVNLTWNGAAWDACLDASWNGGSQTCGTTATYTDAQLGAVFPDPADRTQSAWANLCWTQSPQPGPSPMLIFDPNGASGAGLYVATQGQNGQLVSTGTRYTAQANDVVCGGINGQIWITWDGAAWLQKTVTAYDPTHNLPTFGPTDVPYAFVLGRQYYLNDQGVNYVVQTADGATFDVQIERQTVARPDNAAAFAPAGTVFQRPWGDTTSRFALDVDATSATFLKLRYTVVGTQDAQGGAAVGDVLTTGTWGLTASLNGTPQADQYNWEYPSQPGDTWSTQQFLVDGSGHFVFLDDAIRLAPVALQNHAGLTKQYALQFDGNWVGGLPDIYSLLQGNGYQMTADVAAQVVTIPDGTLVTDGTSQYLFKAMELQQFLPVLPGGASLSLAAATAIDLAGAPTFDASWANTAAQPTVPLKYSEGALVH